MNETSLYWWIDTFARSRVAGFRWHVVGRFDDVKYPDWPDNGRPFCWTIPSLTNGGGRYAFALRPIGGTSCA